jgi:hypothetical protein
LDKILRGASPKKDHTTGRGVASQVGGFQHTSDDVEGKAVSPQVAVFGNPDADGRISDGRAIEQDTGLVSGPHNAPGGQGTTD